MKFDVYTYYSIEVKKDDNTTEDKSIRKNFKNISMEDAKEKVNEFLDSLPEEVTGIHLNVEKTYDERLQAELNNY